MRRWQAAAGLKPEFFPDFLPLEISANAGAAWTENAGEPGEYLYNYGLAWAESWKPLVPDWGAGAAYRNGSGGFSLNLGTLPVGARLSLEASSAFNGTGGTTRSSSLGRLDIPWQPEFKKGRYSFVFSGSRQFTRDLYYAGGDFRDDAGRWGESVSDAMPLFYSIPFYSLFNPDMGGKMAEANSQLSGAPLGYSRFIDSFESSVRMPPNYGLSSFFIPAGAAFRISRSLDQKMDIPLDTLSIGGNVRFDAINMFGAFGAAPLFMFYQSDEFSHSIDASASFPKNEKVSWRVQDAEYMSFRGFEGAELAVNNTFTVNSASSAEKGARLTESLSLVWTAPVKNSLLSLFYSRFTGM
jgi:hypothetical protein